MISKDVEKPPIYDKKPEKKIGTDGISITFF